MAYRRKIILALLSVFDGQLTAKQFQKYLFLFTRKQETKSFDFIPYRYGCFSFQANQDVATLTNYGYCKITEIKKVRFFELTKNDNFINTLKPEDRKSLLDIKEQFGNLSQKELIRYTYRQYPYYAIKSVIAENLLNSTELNAIELQKQHYSENNFSLSVTKAFLLKPI